MSDHHQCEHNIGICNANKEYEEPFTSHDSHERYVEDCADCEKELEQKKQEYSWMSKAAKQYPDINLPNDPTEPKNVETRKLKRFV